VSSLDDFARRPAVRRSIDGNATGDTVDARKVTIASIPHMSDIGTFTLNGVDTTLANQMRLRSGAFARVKDNGESEIHLNVLPARV
jgi:DNA-directed RNA polymerase beta subunit